MRSINFLLTYLLTYLLATPAVSFEAETHVLTLTAVTVGFYHTRANTVGRQCCLQKGRPSVYRPSTGSDSRQGIPNEKETNLFTVICLFLPLRIYVISVTRNVAAKII